MLNLRVWRSIFEARSKGRILSGPRVPRQWRCRPRTLLQQAPPQRPLDSYFKSRALPGGLPPPPDPSAPRGGCRPPGHPKSASLIKVRLCNGPRTLSSDVLLLRGGTSEFGILIQSNYSIE
eukprot:13605553-Alexandrium_andersonii.AAC.1